MVEDTPKFTEKLQLYLHNGWNKFDLICFLFLLTSVILRFALPVEYFHWARYFYCVTLFLYFLRLLEISYAFKQIGPLFVMFTQMLNDVRNFL